MATTVTLTGIAEMNAQMAQLVPKVRGKVVNQALLEAATLLRDEVKRRAPYKTGNLRDNIILYRARNPQQTDQVTAKYSVLVRKIKKSRAVKKLLRKVKAANASVRITDDAFYWRFSEFGTVHEKAKPWFRPAIDAVKGQFIETVGNALQSEMDKALASVKR